MPEQTSAPALPAPPAIRSRPPERPCRFFGGQACYAGGVKKTKWILSRREMLTAWRRRDARYDGLFCFGVKSTGIFCRPSCPSQPRESQLEFFHQAAAARRAGYRPCKRCRPELAPGQPPAWLAPLLRRTAGPTDCKLPARELRRLHLPPERVRRWFQKHLGLSFAEWNRSQRLARAFAAIHAGRRLDSVVFDHGYESFSGFRSAFLRAFGQTPRRTMTGDHLRVALCPTPLGPMLAVARGDALCQLEFADVRNWEHSHHALRRRFNLPVARLDNAVLQQLRSELDQYFAGTLKKFTVPVVWYGSSFQSRVWRELRKIPYGKIASYTEVARRLGVPRAARAVARANATNRLYLLVPCHRVVAKNGTLSGYGGGVWRKRMLLNLEHAGHLSGQTTGEVPAQGT